MSAIVALSPLLLLLAPGVRHDGDGASIERLFVPAGTMFLAGPGTSTRAAAERALAVAADRSAEDWRLAYDARGAPLLLGGRRTALSIGSAAAPGVRAVMLAAGPIGIDVETLPRIALNASADDDWLGHAERVLLAAMDPADAVVELACRWVLREAYGKALGRGLDVPLGDLAFTVHAGRVVLPAARDRWRFSLHRRDDLIVGIAAGGSGG